MEQVGWFVVGGPNFGEYLFNNPIVHLRAQFIPLMEMRDIGQTMDIL
nr:MAG: hypothetical protein [Caudoviricetes sp.]